MSVSNYAISLDVYTFLVLPNGIFNDLLQEQFVNLTIMEGRTKLVYTHKVKSLNNSITFLVALSLLFSVTQIT